MSTTTLTNSLPLLPLVLDGIPPGLRQALSQEGIFYVERGVARLAGRFVLFDSRSGRCRGLAAEQIPIDVDFLRRAGSGDSFEDLLDERAAEQCYKIGGLELRQTFACIDKRQVRRRMMKLLREALERHGGVWLKLSPYPFPYRSVFNLRSTYETAEGISEALADVQGYERGTSHFVCGAALEARPELADRLAGLDVGSLGYQPRVSDDTEENVANIRQGIRSLQMSGLEPRGFAPAGATFSLSLLAALEVLRVSHCTATSWCYDELPYFPGSSHVLHLPAHPLGLGSEADQLPTSVDADRRRPRLNLPQALEEYFAALIEARYQCGEPLLLHRSAFPRFPGSREVVREALSAAARCGALWRTTLAELADWWRARARVRLKVAAYGDEFLVQVDGNRPAQRLAAEYWRGEHVALLPLDETTTSICPTALAFECRRSRPLPVPQRVDLAEPLRRMVRKRSAGRAADDSGIRALRDWMTRTLRRPWE